MPPARATRLLCDSLVCPAAISCAKHLWRSRAYATVESLATYTRTPPPGRDACIEYRCDTPRAWMLSPHEAGRLAAAVLMLHAAIDLVAAARSSP